MKLFPPGKVAEMTESGQWTDDTWDAQLRRHVEGRGDAVALLDPPNRTNITNGEPRRLTWTEVDREVDHIAAHLLAAEIGVDDIVAVQLPNTVELALVFLAIGRIGAIATPFPAQYREHELAMLTSLVGARAFITMGTMLGRENAAAISAMASDIESMHSGAQRIGDDSSGGPLEFSGFGASRSTYPLKLSVLAWGSDLPDGVIDLGAPVADAGANAPVGTHSVKHDDCVTICWTSGTESVPKAIPRAYCDWGAVGWGCVDAPSLTADDVILNPFPLVNMGAFGGLFCPWLLTGCTLVMHHPFDMEAFLTQVRDERVTYTVMAPALLTRLLQQPETLEQWDLSSLRAVGSGSAPVPGSTIVGWEDRGVEIINFFGSNEGMNLIGDRTSVPDPRQRGLLFPSYRADPDSLRVRTGRFTDIRLVDTETGDDIDEPGRVGELLLSGPTVFAGYHAGTGRADVFDDRGFYRSGDLFEFVDDRLELLRYQGRATDLIVRGGFNISPAEIESVLQDHPDIAEVAVIGVPDDELGERIGAFIVPAADHLVTREELASFMEGAQVAKYKWPEHVRHLDELPRNPVGKVLHRDLRDRFEMTK